MFLTGVFTGAASGAAGAGAHPRAYGENVSESALPKSFWGSSPRIRGKPGERHRAAVAIGLIPAHTGKTVSRTDAYRCAGAHPRAYGENLQSTWNPVTVAGSSPRIRGKHPARPARSNGRGLIPAHTGKTNQLIGCRAASRAHPRAYGENRTRPASPPTSPGSSPRIRGKH